MDQELYWHSDSILHRLDPRLKVGGLAILSLLLTLTHWQGLALTSAMLIGLVLINHAPLKMFRGMTLVLLWLGLFYCFAAGWTWSESASFWQGHWSQAGLIQAMIMLWRIALVFTLTRLFAAVTLPMEQGLGIIYFFAPLTRFSSRAAEFALLLTMTLRFIPLLLEEGSLIWKARLIKGNWPDSWLRRSWEIVQMIVPIILISLKRAEELGENMIARGYGSGSVQSFLFHERTVIDFWCGFIMALWGLLLLIWH
ncbi:ABC-type cobalt transport system, permease component CbiQ [Desulfosporosinus acidiphilus SJ4]|uniref:ABC-type cobalt transport system, permease component CbiQ n=2 Tax=Desulfosporosinus TaxID=79206 RepID=I4D1B3_DESAJ|nr:ABC-type cobalt transport system, permease component CbiQ [Desulfosporosinus acidiphilus SJ4]